MTAVDTGTRSDKRTQFLTDVLTTAAEGGIRYWAAVTSYRWDCPPDERHVSFLELEADDDLVHTVRLDDIARALGKFARQEVGCRFVESAGAGQVMRADRTNGDEGDVDAADADCLVQIAALGQVVYG